MLWVLEHEESAPGDGVGDDISDDRGEERALGDGANNPAPADGAGRYLR